MRREEKRKKEKNIVQKLHQVDFAFVGKQLPTRRRES